MKEKLIPKVRVGPKGKIENIPLGTGTLRKTVDIIRERQKKQADILKKLEK